MHCFGDYVLQIDFIAKTKRDNLYHLFVHVVLYCIPFLILFDIYQIILLFIFHIITDYLKCKGNISYITDQSLHYFQIFIIYLLI